MTAVVYRVFDREGALLYIGSTEDFGSRRAVHMSTTDTPIAFTIQMCAARWTTEEFPSISEAQVAECAAIAAEAPYLNRQHNCTRWVRRAGQWVPLMPEYEPVWAHVSDDDSGTTLATLNALFGATP